MSSNKTVNLSIFGLTDWESNTWLPFQRYTLNPLIGGWSLK